MMDLVIDCGYKVSMTIEGVLEEEVEEKKLKVKSSRWGWAACKRMAPRR